MMMEIMVRMKVMLVTMIMISLLVKIQNFQRLRSQLVDLPSQRFTKDCASGRGWGEGDVMIIISVRMVWDDCEILTTT